MKKYKKDHLPVQITVNETAFVLDITNTQRHKFGVKLSGKHHIEVSCLSKNLRGRTDLHGNLYQPTIWIYSDRIGRSTIKEPIKSEEDV